MNFKVVNPWSWQDSFHFSQAVEVPEGRRVVFLAGQTSVDPDGHPLHQGDMRAQLERAFENLELVLEQAGLTLANLVRLNYYVTDMAAYASAGGVVAACRQTFGMPARRYLSGPARAHGRDRGDSGCLILLLPESCRSPSSSVVICGK
jgi:enamine deaminase RidA (YjgF/YER057c/UK114 family)